MNEDDERPPDGVSLVPRGLLPIIRCRSRFPPCRTEGAECAVVLF
jgi:hypothetical protein